MLKRRPGSCWQIHIIINRIWIISNNLTSSDALVPQRLNILNKSSRASDCRWGVREEEAKLLVALRADVIEVHLFELILAFNYATIWIDKKESNVLNENQPLQLFNFILWLTFITNDHQLIKFPAKLEKR